MILIKKLFLINLDLFYLQMIRFFYLIIRLIIIILLILPFLITILIIFTIHKIIEKDSFFFTQDRLGLNKQIIKIVKIRTINNNKISKFSNFLRKTKLDEMPQIISVVRGDLNLIGPRPLLVEYKQYFKNSEEIRFSIKPGIAGLSQIKSTNLTCWDTRLRWDVIYAKKRCFKLDIYILLNTIKIIFLNIFKKQNNLDNFIRLDKVRKI